MLSESTERNAGTGSPIPTKFYPEEESFLDDLKGNTGLSNSELIRRGIRFLKRQKELTGSHAFILELKRSAA